MRVKNVLLLVKLTEDTELSGDTVPNLNVPIFGHLWVSERDNGGSTIFMLDKIVLSFEESRKALKERCQKEVWIRASGTVEARVIEGFYELSQKDRNGGPIELDWDFELYVDIVEFVSTHELDTTTAP